jgi:hypothetical protein
VANVWLLGPRAGILQVSDASDIWSSISSNLDLQCDIANILLIFQGMKESLRDLSKSLKILDHTRVNALKIIQYAKYVDGLWRQMQRVECRLGITLRVGIFVRASDAARLAQDTVQYLLNARIRRGREIGVVSSKMPVVACLRVVPQFGQRGEKGCGLHRLQQPLCDTIYAIELKVR